MAWQEDRETSVIDAIAIAAAETAAPTAPDTGAAFDWDGVGASDWTEVAAKLAEDDISFTDGEGNIVPVKAPTDIAVQEYVVISPPGILERVEITHFEVGSKVVAMASNITDSTGVQTPGTTYTERAVIIQWKGFGWLYIPRAKIFAGTPSGGVQTLSKQVVTIMPQATSTVASGYKFIQFQDAA